MPLTKVGRSYVVILKEEGVQHAPVVFPCDVTPPFIVRNFSRSGYEVLDHETKETPDDERHIATFTLTVRKSRLRSVEVR